MVELKKLTSLPLVRNIGDSEIKKDLLNFDEIRLKKIIQKHVQITNSLKGKFILENWNDKIKKFVKVTPLEFKKALENKNNNEANQVVKIVGE